MIVCWLIHERAKSMPVAIQKSDTCQGWSQSINEFNYIKIILFRKANNYGVIERRGSKKPRVFWKCWFSGFHRLTIAPFPSFNLHVSTLFYHSIHSRQCHPPRACKLTLDQAVFCEFSISSIQGVGYTLPCFFSFHSYSCRQRVVRHKVDVSAYLVQVR